MNLSKRCNERLAKRLQLPQREKVEVSSLDMWREKEVQAFLDVQPATERTFMGKINCTVHDLLRVLLLTCNVIIAPWTGIMSCKDTFVTRARTALNLTVSEKNNCMTNYRKCTCKAHARCYDRLTRKQYCCRL